MYLLLLDMLSITIQRKIYLMAMTKKHFEAIANAVATTRMQHEGVAAYEVLLDVSQRLAVVCAQENEQFNKAKFLRACGV